MADTMFRIGGFDFSLSTAAPQKMETSSSYRWPSIERLMRRPALQFVGMGEQTITLSGVIFTLFNAGGGSDLEGPVGIQQINAMLQVGDTPVPHEFYDGIGNYYGKFVVRSVRATHSDFFASGAPRKQEFDIELARYGDDEKWEKSVVYAS